MIDVFFYLVNFRAMQYNDRICTQQQLPDYSLFMQIVYNIFT